MKIASLLVNILGALLAALSIPSIMGALMMFDGGGTDRPVLVAAFNLWHGLPVVCLVSQVFAWVTWARGNYKIALASTLAAVLYACLIVAALALGIR